MCMSWSWNKSQVKAESRERFQQGASWAFQNVRMCCFWFRCLWHWSSNISNRAMQFINVDLSLMSFFTCINMLAVWTQWRITGVLCHFRWWVVVSERPTWDLNCAFLFQQTLIIDDMWWSKLNKINDLCCCNEKDFFFSSHAFILLWWRHGWIGWAYHISRGREINIMPDFSSAMSGYQLKSNCFTLPSWLQDMCYFKLNLQGPKVIYLCQNGGRMEFWETTINSLWM